MDRVPGRPTLRRRTARSRPPAGRSGSGMLWRQFHQQGHAAGAVVGADERPRGILSDRDRERDACRNEHRAAPAVCARDANGRSGWPCLPANRRGIAAREIPAVDRGPQLLEMVGQQLLLGLHAGRAAEPRPDAHRFLEISVSPGAVERDVGELQPRMAWAGSPATPSARRTTAGSRGTGRWPPDGHQENRLTRRLDHGLVAASRRNELDTILSAAASAG